MLTSRRRSAIIGVRELVTGEGNNETQSTHREEVSGSEESISVPAQDRTGFSSFMSTDYHQLGREQLGTAAPNMAGNSLPVPVTYYQIVNISLTLEQGNEEEMLDLNLSAAEPSSARDRRSVCTESQATRRVRRVRSNTLQRGT